MTVIAQLCVGVLLWSYLLLIVHIVHVILSRFEQDDLSTLHELLELPVHDVKVLSAIAMYVCTVMH